MCVTNIGIARIEGYAIGGALGSCCVRSLSTLLASVAKGVRFTIFGDFHEKAGLLIAVGGLANGASRWRR
jgi:hypothetical protein